MRVADNDAVSFIKGLIFYGFYDFAEKRVGNFQDQQADEVRPVARQTLGDEIRFIIQLFDPVEYLLACLCLDGRVVGENPGDGDSGNPRFVGNILHADHGITFIRDILFRTAFVVKNRREGAVGK